MLSRLIGTSIGRNFTTKTTNNLVLKRWSGHNAMNIEPSNYYWKHMKDMMHLYTLIGAIPVIVITTIINIRANPELTEIPEGYEPRHWEYYKHPLTRLMAKYLYKPMEIEHELQMALKEYKSEAKIISEIQQKAERTMKFYNDHRSRYFHPYYADYVRIGRDDVFYGAYHVSTNEGRFYDMARDPSTPVPVEGYVPSRD